MVRKTLSQRDIKEITEDINVSLKALDEIVSQPIDVGANAQEEAQGTSSFDSKKIEELENSIDNLEDTVAFFEEKKNLLSDFATISEDDFNALDIEKKTLLLDFIDSSYEKTSKDGKNKPEDLNKEKFQEIIKKTFQDIDSFIKETSEQMSQLRKGLDEEEQRHSDLQRDILRKRLEGEYNAEKKIRMSVEERRQAFDSETAKLNILEEELRLAMIDESNSSQVDNIRKFLREKS